MPQPLARSHKDTPQTYQRLLKRLIKIINKSFNFRFKLRQELNIFNDFTCVLLLLTEDSIFQFSTNVNTVANN